MKRKGLILVLIALFALVLFNGSNKDVDAADDKTVTMTSFSATSASMDNIVKYSTAKGGGTSNPAVNSNQIRLYQNSAGTGGGTITISVEEGYVLSSVTIGSSMNTTIAYTLGSSTTKSSKQDLSQNGKATIAVNNTSVTVYCMGTTSSTRLYVNYLSATYSAIETDAPKVTINNAISKLEVGQEYELNATTENFDGNVLWSSSNNNVASFDKNRLIAHTVGSVVITATAGEAKDSFNLNVYSDAMDLQTLVNSYYNNGVYTKKSVIYLTSDAQKEIAQYFHGNVDTVRTTYYYNDGNGNGNDLLLMANFDGSYAEVNGKNQPVDGINSGYRTDGNNMKHFVYKDGNIVDTYTVYNTTVAEYYIALDDMIVDGFFDSWNLVGGKYVYTVPEVQMDENGKPLVDDMLHNFLWFAAPCLEDSVFANPKGVYYLTAEGIQLVVSEETNEYYGDYLSLQIVLTSDDVDKSTNEGVLAEARVYKGNSKFNDSVKPVEVLLDDAESDLLKNYTNTYKNISADHNLQKTVTANFDTYKESLNITWKKGSEVITTLKYTNPTSDTPVDLVAVITVEDEVDGEKITYTREVSITITMLKKNTATLVATLSFANKNQRTEFTTTKQVWEQNGITLTNNKASSSSNMGDYANPVRLYASSEVVVEYTSNIMKIEFICQGSSYANALKDSIGASAVVSGSNVTVELDGTTNLFKISKLTKQVQLKSINIYV